MLYPHATHTVSRSSSSTHILPIELSYLILPNGSTNQLINSTMEPAALSKNPLTHANDSAPCSAHTESAARVSAPPPRRTARASQSYPHPLCPRRCSRGKYNPTPACCTGPSWRRVACPLPRARARRRHRGVRRLGGTASGVNW